MTHFHEALDAYLQELDGGEIAFAEQTGLTQATINRYRNGRRFPDAERARTIDAKSSGAVPFSIWHADFLRRSGLTSSDTEAA